MFRAAQEDGLSRPTGYDQFYARGGWKYDVNAERHRLQRYVVDAARWKPGESVIDVGAGMCLHAELLRQMAFDVLAIEASPVAVKHARERYPNLRVVLSDASQCGNLVTHHVFARGMSYFHYELDGVNKHGIDVPAETERMFRWIRPGGTFVLQIATDFAGGPRPKRPGAGEGGVYMNKREGYEQLFSRFGTVESITDWDGRAVSNDRKPSHGVIVVTRKAG